MSSQAKAGASPASATPVDEERLIQTLVQRALITIEEAAECRKTREGAQKGARELLNHLITAGFLTKNQAKRVVKELQESAAPQKIPGYKILEKLGQGAMGTVFKAKQLSMNRFVAVKTLLPRLAAVPGYLDRFYREAHLAARLSHAHIVQAIDVGSAGATHYFIMEYVEGTTIQEILNKGKVYNEPQAVKIVHQIALALEHAHQRKLVHRDIKPANIMLTKDGSAKLADLGIARNVEDQELAKQEKGKTIGTPYYIAPELIRGRLEADIRADIYSLGATLYHMVTGRPPFQAETVQDVIKARLEEELIPPDHINTTLSGGLGETVEFMMAKDREGRYRTPAELLVDLDCLLRGEPPKLAHQRAAASKFQDLSSGEVVQDEIVYVKSKKLSVAIVVLAVLLGISIAINIVLSVL